MKDYPEKKASCHGNKEDRELVKESDVLSQKITIWDELISGMLNLALAQLREAKKYPVYSTGEPD